MNLLGAIDNGTGNWATGYQADFGHPNQAGHTEFFYTDANLAGTDISERLQLDTFFVGGILAPTMMDIRDWFFYRSGMNEEEIQAIHQGRMLKSSLELYAPLDGQAVLGNFPFINLAQSTNRLTNDFSTSIEEVELDPKNPTYRYFPNPVEELLTIEPLGNQIIEQVDILDITGKKISSQKNSNQISFQEAGAGIFFIKIHTTTGQVSSFKIVKEE